MPHIGAPEAVIEQAIAALETPDSDIYAVSPVIRTAPVGPSSRLYANAAALLASPLPPPDLLLLLQSVEAHFGRQRRGQCWRARTLDLDIILWSGGIWVSDDPPLAIPHPAMRQRHFVLGPARTIAPQWRDPLTNRTIGQLFHRLRHAKPLDRR